MGAVGRQPRFQLFLLLKKEPVMMQASPAKSMVRMFLQFLLIFSVFSIASGLDQKAANPLEAKHVQMDLTDKEVIRKEREALPKEQHSSKKNTKKKRRENNKKKSSKKAKKGKRIKKKSRKDKKIKKGKERNVKSKKRNLRKKK